MATPFVTVLGGGPAGLGAAYFARQRSWDVTLLEASDRIGGNCITNEREGFRFDSGAHRFHDKDPEITSLVKRLLGDELRKVSAESAICLDRRFLTFPPSTSRLLEFLGPGRFITAAAGALTARARRRGEHATLESYAIRAYGPRLARLFLLNYSQKLWGVPCSTLSPAVSGGRLRGLRLSALFKRGASAHLEGSFYYPANGYGRIVDRLAEESGGRTIRTGARVTRLFHHGDRIRQVEVNGGERLDVDQVISTLPLGPAVRLFEPALPDEIVRLVDAVRFRNVVLAVLFLDRPSITPLATVYFPDPAVPFTRVYEPRNRSAAMAPAGKTSLAVEIPCSVADAVWRAPDEDVIARVRPALASLGWIDSANVIGTCVLRIPHAYPVLTLEAVRASASILEYLDRFSNLRPVGRNGLFQYSWLHTVLRTAKTTVDELAGDAGRRPCDN